MVHLIDFLLLVELLILIEQGEDETLKLKVALKVKMEEEKEVEKDSQKSQSILTELLLVVADPLFVAIVFVMKYYLEQIQVRLIVSLNYE
jgi:hypothetical protein